MNTPETNYRVRAEIFERTCTLTGRPVRLQYARNLSGVVFTRIWEESVHIGFKGREGRTGRWSKWRNSNGNIPVSAQSTGGFTYVPTGAGYYAFSRKVAA